MHLKAHPTSSITVVMATYNGERFLKAQLESLARQTLLPSELIVCDDASKDQTVEILQEFKETAPFPVRLILHQKNTGHGEAFLEGAQAATSEYVAFCDQDDVWLENKLSILFEAMEKWPHVVLACHSAQQVDENLDPLPGKMPDNGSRMRIAGTLESFPISSFPGFACLVRQRIIQLSLLGKRPIDFARPQYLQAHDLVVYHVANAFGSIAYLPDVLALYRRHSRTVTGTPGTGIYHEESPLQRIRTAYQCRRKDYELMADQALQHEVFYRSLMSRLGANSRERLKAEAAAEFYARVADQFSRRAKLYESGVGRTRRISCFFQAIKAGGYKRLDGRKGVETKWLVKDAIAALLPDSLCRETSEGKGPRARTDI